MCIPTVWFISTLIKNEAINWILKDNLKILAANLRPSFGV